LGGFDAVTMNIGSGVPYDVPAIVVAVVQNRVGQTVQMATSLVNLPAYSNVTASVVLVGIPFDSGISVFAESTYEAALSLKWSVNVTIC
jgi:hypothetical protein